MKKTIITSAFLLFAQVAIFAQTPVASPSDGSVQTPKNDRSKGRDNNREKQPKMSAADRAVQYSNELKTTLTLTPDQYQKVLAVNTECISRKDAMKGSGDKGAMKTGKADIKAYRLGEFQKIFTAQQMTAYQQMNANKNEKDDDEKDGNRGERGKGKGHGKEEGEQKTSN
jgi:hypothetical protein